MKLVYRYLSYVLLMSAAFRLFPLGMAFFLKEPILNISISIGITLFVALFFKFFDKKIEKDVSYLSLEKAILLVVFSFLVLSLIGSISYLPYTSSFTDALFESVSGYTTTGMTVFGSLDSLPTSFLTWRAQTQWIGGLGIILFFLLLVTLRPSNSEGGDVESQNPVHVLYRAQGFSEKLEATVRGSLRRIIFIYVGFTVLGFLALYAAGYHLFEALGLAFTSISTGGFLMGDNFSMTFTQSVILILLMLLGATSFILFNNLTKKGFGLVLKNSEFVFRFILMLVGFLIISLYMGSGSEAIFNVVSAFTTTGFAKSNLALLQPAALFVMALGMVAGGSSASTGGGIKIQRLFVMLKSIPWHIKKMVSPQNSVILLKTDDSFVEEKELMSVYIFAFSYLVLIALAIFVFLLLGIGFSEAGFNVVSALGTVGLQTFEISSQHVVAKYILIALMLLGRLEIFPIFIAVKYFTRQLVKNRG